MCHRSLTQLTTDDFVVASSVFNVPIALRRFLLRRPEIEGVRDALKKGEITEEIIRDFVSTLMRDFSIGQRFVHEIALTALAVALEKRPTDFAEEFLADLAKLQLAEMPLCIRVARECLKQRCSVSQNIRKEFFVSHPSLPQTSLAITSRNNHSHPSIESLSIRDFFDLRDCHAKA